MNKRLGLLIAVVGFATFAAEMNTADARGRVRFSSSGGGYRGHVHARVRGNVSVNWNRGYRGYAQRPAYRGWSTGGRIYVGGYRPYYRPYYGYYPRYYYYNPVPSYYGYYYPVEAAPQPAAAPSVVAAVAPPPQLLPKFGVGLFAGGSAVEDIEESSDMGLLGRFRLGNGGLLIEGEIGKTSYQDDLRVDRRLGASLVYEIGAYNKLAPYVLAGLGVQQADVAGEFTTTQNFAEIGVGLRYALSPNVHILFDVRAGSRQSMSQDGREDVVTRSVTPPAPGSDDIGEQYTRARLAAMLYF
jgi:hypothetical protein